MPDDKLLPLGVTADTGERLPSIEDESVEVLVSDKDQDPQVEIEAVKNKVKQDLGTDDSIADPNNLAKAGWAVMWGASVSDSIKKALAPLLEHRRKQTGKDARLYVEFTGDASYVQGDTATGWLSKNDKNIPMADVNPRAGVPYYVMIVASAEEIPFEFQYGLDLFWAVGRLWFPTAAAFARYAQSVVDYETAGSVATSKQMAIFSPRNGADGAMGLLCDNLANPMLRATKINTAFGADQDFKLRPFIGQSATKETLDNIWRGRKIPGGPPAVVFTGSHGMRFLSGDDRQTKEQGAIVCNEWDGGGEAPSPSQYYAGRDLPDDAKVHGMVHFLFDCYGLGWPKKDTFSRLKDRVPSVAPGPSLARLPQELLSHPNGGALAVLGHIDRAWSSSYSSEKGGPQINGFRSVMTRLMAGNRVGHATDRFNQRWATLSIELAEEMAKEDFADREALRRMWVARDDARNYIVLGDPAVQLRVDDMPVLSA